MMKNLIAITCFVVALVSCNKVEHKLEGKWQLKTVEANGVVQTVDTVWYNFQTSLFEYQLYDPAKDVYRTNFGYKTLEGDTAHGTGVGTWSSVSWLSFAPSVLSGNPP